MNIQLVTSFRIYGTSFGNIKLGSYQYNACSLLFGFRFGLKLLGFLPLSSSSCSRFTPTYDLQRFAAADEGRTELPGERRQREERERGNVPRSQEIISAATLFGTVVVLIISGVYLLSNIEQMFKSYLEFDFRNTKEVANITGIRRLVFDMGFQVGKVTAPILISAMLIGVVANVSQFGFLFTAYPLGIRLNKIKPDFKRILPGRRTLFNLGRVVVQVILISVSAYAILMDDYTSMLKSSNIGLYQAIALFAQVALKLLIVTSLILALVSIPDYLYQRFEYFENLKITVSEAKRERKDDEGDPLMRQRQRDRAYELRKQRDMLQDVTNADVIITNPTHFAVGLKYEPNISSAPIVVAKGADHLAFIIRNIAKEHNILIEENPPLARALFDDVELGQEIPDTLYRFVSFIFSKLNHFQRAGVGNA